MRIVDRKTFLEMPEGTVYSKYHSCAFDGPEIKAETIGRDWYETSIGDPWVATADDSMENWDTLSEAEKTGVSFPIEIEALCRDGLFEEDQLFAIWKRPEIEKLIELLSAALQEIHESQVTTKLDVRGPLKEYSKYPEMTIRKGAKVLEHMPKNAIVKVGDESFRILASETDKDTGNVTFKMRSMDEERAIFGE